jgi:proteasome accessory factor A
VLKRSLLDRALNERPDLDWGSPEIKHLDLMYSSLDEHNGLYWACERSTLVERIVTDAEIERFVHEPPEDTRAWTRAMLLRVGGDSVDAVNWDEITFDCSKAGEWRRLRTAELADPLAFTRAEWEPHVAGAASFEDLLDRLDRPGPTAGTARVRDGDGEIDQRTDSEEPQMESET